MKQFFFLLITSFLMFSCRVQDSTAPTLEIVKPNFGETFNLGDTLTFEATFNDNEQLGSYSIFAGNVSKDTNQTLNFSEGNSISGTDHTYKSEIIIPNSLTDTVLYFYLLLNDEAGNSRNQRHFIRIN